MFCLTLPVRLSAHLRTYAPVVAAAALVTAPLVAAGVPPTRADADSMLRKVAVIATNGLSECYRAFI